MPGEARRERAQARVADLEAHVGDAERRAEEQALGGVEAQGAEELARRSARHLAEDAAEVERAHVRLGRQVLEREGLVQMRAHQLHYALDRGAVGGAQLGPVISHAAS